MQLPPRHCGAFGQQNDDDANNSQTTSRPTGRDVVTGSCHTCERVASIVLAPLRGTKTLADYSPLMDTKIVKAAVDRVLATYTHLGLKGDEEYRDELRENVTSFVERLVERGEQDVAQLVAHSLRHLRSLEARESPHRPA